MDQSSGLGLRPLPQLAFGVSPSISWQGGSTCGEASTLPPPSPRGRPLMSSQSLSVSRRPEQATGVASLRQQVTAHLHNWFCTLDPDVLNLCANPCGEINLVFTEEFHVRQGFWRIFFMFCNTNANPAYFHMSTKWARTSRSNSELAGSAFASMFLAIVVTVNNGEVQTQSEKGKNLRTGELDNSPKYWSESLQHIEQDQSSHLPITANYDDAFGVKTKPYGSQKVKLRPTLSTTASTTTTTTTSGLLRLNDLDTAYLRYTS